MSTLDALNTEFGIDDKLQFLEGKGGLTLFRLSHSGNTVEGYLYGGHICSFVHGGEELLWMSSTSFFEKAQPIRGGIPLCFPWFGPSELDSLPQHGYLRLSEMQVKACSCDDKAVSLVLQLATSAIGVAGNFAALDIELELKLGSSLAMHLRAVNSSTETQKVTAALHTYFEVSNVEQVDIPALHGLSYLDKTQDYASFEQVAPFAINCEHDRVFSKAPQHVELLDPGNKRRIIIESEGNNNTVVWNPGAEKAVGIGDFDETRQANMLCIEPACALDDAVMLKPGESFELAQRLWAEPIGS
ncbi:glucose-6-phosphate 1-epimerase [Alteromonadaceae bacterium Bs31]|nr:glucose-6-phosphate 1-epimerase [Alteromonadaceae bacterium Bs31]